MHRLIAATLCALAASSAGATDEIKLENWFDDPFFQVRNGIQNCPIPLGPLLTEAGKVAESHSRIERGTSCWMAGTCAQPNAYLYDKSIAEAIRHRFATSELFSNTSVWITVKRKFAWVEGCVADPAQATQLETLVKSVPDVEYVLVNLMTGIAGKPPYAVLPTP